MALVYDEEMHFVVENPVSRCCSNPFSIKDEHGEVVVEAAEHVLSFHDTVDAEYADGSPAFQLYRKLVAMSEMWFIQIGDKIVATLRRDQVSCVHDTLRVYEGEASFDWGNNTESPMLYTVQRELCTCVPTRTIHEGDEDGPEVAETTERICDWGNFFMCKQVYDIAVQPGADALIIFAVCVAQDIIDAQRAAASNAGSS